VRVVAAMATMIEALADESRGYMRCTGGIVPRLD
jgi:hypothetical protein